ncbi:glycosyltransferase family A protein [Ornithinimicrobium cavernae]|uniref:glycosyltransferase family A protein n=1 Tax=Ornithinimicrobium cavernae TaxID=2666047 RepID=UPI000D68A208|nr:glycosyltransferase family A protein [Ornithinimicrobium cavernae]
MLDRPRGPGATHPVQPVHGPGYRTAWQLWRRGEHPDALAHLALRTRSPVVLDALALTATGGSLTVDQLLGLGTIRFAPGRTAPAAALALALAGTGRSVEDLVAAADLYEELWAADALGDCAPIHHQALAQAFLLTGRHDRLRRVLPDLNRLAAPVRHDVEVDLANPHLAGGAVALADHQRWVHLLTSRFVDAGLEPVQVSGEATHLFDRLRADPGLRGTAGPGPLVTVIMPCYRPDEGLLTSLASISNQTWGDLEILVVDDASGPDHEELFERAVASDDRARLVRMPRNGGSYLGRNAALEQARGELVTFQDADDWSHPRRIEHQARLLTADAEAAASRSLAVRAKDDLTHQWFGYRSVRDNASSLMVRRSVIDRIGPFGAIRKGADSEYAERVTCLAGPVLDTGTPLAITRLRTGTLSRGDFTYQWSTPERLVFKGSYRAWHRRLTTDREGGPPATSAVLGPDDQLGCPVPRSFLRGLDHYPDWDTVPVAYLGDLSADPRESGAGADGHLWRELGEPREPRVGLWHLETAAPPVRRKRPEMHDAWFDRLIASEGAVVPLTRLDEVRVERLVVLDPGVLLLAEAQPCRLRAGQVEVWLSPRVLAPDTSGLPIDLLAVSDTCRAWWGTGPRWVPAPGLSEAQVLELEELLPGLLSP